MIGVSVAIARNNATGERSVLIDAAGRQDLLSPLEARDLAQIIRTFKRYELSILAADLEELAGVIEKGRAT